MILMEDKKLKGTLLIGRDTETIWHTKLNGATAGEVETGQREAGPLRQAGLDSPGECLNPSQLCHLGHILTTCVSLIH